MTRMPTPAASADENDSISPLYTRISVSRSWTTTASTCSSSRAMATTRSPISRSRSVSTLIADSGRGAADREARHPQGRNTVAHRDALPVFATGARRAHGEVVSERIDGREHLGTVADEVALPQRSGDLAVLDEVRLGHAEHEVARGGVDLAAAELLDEHAVVRARDDLAWIEHAVLEIGVRHAHHRQV